MARFRNLAESDPSSWTLGFVADSQESEIARLAGHQRTMLGIEQLLACGLGKGAVKYRVRTGRYTEVFRGVISVVSDEFPPLAREQAALIACRAGAFLSHHTAAFIWGLRQNHPHDIDVTVVDRYVRSRKGIRVHHTCAVDKRDVRRHEGLWVSSPARALLEIAATLNQTDLRDAVGNGIESRRIKPGDLEDILARNEGRRGSARLANVTGDPDAVAITRSKAERAFLKLIRDAHLPIPEVNKPLGRYVPDFMWREQKLIVEIDSYRYHGGPDAFENDRNKDLAYRDAGFDVLRFTRNQVIYEPAMVLVRVAQALARPR
jgi:very-short-patch-repair endonuclease